MGRRNDRIQALIEIIKNNNVGSQEELQQLLKAQGIHVTQATLSRDLKMLRTTKVPLDQGIYAYMLPDASTLKKQLDLSKAVDFGSHAGNGFLSLEFAGSIAVVKTRNGYASGIAYDIDMLNVPEFIGSIAGANTVFIAIADGVSRERVRDILSLILPLK